LDPAVAASEGDVGALLEAQALVERDRACLVGRGDTHEADLVDPGCGGGHLEPPLVVDSAAWTRGGLRTHRSRCARAGGAQAPPKSQPQRRAAAATAAPSRASP